MCTSHVVSGGNIECSNRLNEGNDECCDLVNEQNDRYVGHWCQVVVLLLVSVI